MEPAESIGVHGMTSLSTKAKRKRDPGAYRKPRKRADDNDTAGRSMRLWRDPGPTLASPEYRSPIFGDPEAKLGRALKLMGRDFGGAWPPDYVPPGTPAAKPAPANPRAKRRLMVAAT